MSRVARIPVDLPAGVSVEQSAQLLSVKGPHGVLTLKLNALVAVDLENALLCVRPVGESRGARAMAGTFRALIANMVEGVSKGFTRKLTLVGVGYRAQAQAGSLSLSLGFSHPVVHAMPEGVAVQTPTPTEILLTGPCKQRVGEVAAEVRA